MKRYAFSIKPEKVDSFFQPPSVKPLFFQVTLNHLIRMGMTKGWKEHTWWRVQQLENDPTGAFKGIQEQFLREIEHAKAKVRADEELQANRSQVDTQTLRGMGEVGGSEVAAGATTKVIGE